MKMKLACLVLCLGLSSCDTVTALVSGQSVAQSSPGISINTEKALTITHLAFQGVSDAILSATSTGLLKGANAAQVRVYYDKAGAALDVADTADKALNEQGVLSAISDAQDAISQAKTLAGGK